MKNEKQRKEFIDFYYEFDRQPPVFGLGKDNLMAVERKTNKKRLCTYQRFYYGKLTYDKKIEEQAEDI